MSNIYINPRYDTNSRNGMAYDYSFKNSQSFNKNIKVMSEDFFDNCLFGKQVNDIEKGLVVMSVFGGHCLTKSAIISTLFASVLNGMFNFFRGYLFHNNKALNNVNKSDRGRALKGAYMNAYRGVLNGFLYGGITAAILKLRKCL